MRALRVSQALMRNFSSTARNRLENRVAEKQKLFQEDNDLPVHLKGGGTDNVLYRLTMALCLGGECRARLGLSFKRPARTGVRKGLVPSLGFGRELTSV
ncbi:cytochrome c oxidase subunit 7A1, mitochondrial isoform X2 [Rousettus aegyptiacus]|uniref:cytochrome c oxidase subunit 7A1, mitochondrial isoform X2 n=1 Tax=Rousettus aegyptiacus TaxID=9407 RepID=UPI00168D721F|nr:cytochrome c oxidase subunit 7A1, mitochondrial isoform X2 [Rousettus aegyptiacus]